MCMLLEKDGRHVNVEVINVAAVHNNFKSFLLLLGRHCVLTSTRIASSATTVLI